MIPNFASVWFFEGKFVMGKWYGDHYFVAFDVEGRRTTGIVFA